MDLRFRAIAAGVAAMMVSTTAAAAAITREFDANPGGRLVIAAEGAKIDVTGRRGDVVRIDISRGSDSAEDIEGDYRITFSHEGDEVRLDMERITKWVGGWFNKTPRISVEVPDRFDVDLESSGGGVKVEGITGVVRARTSGGGLRFEDIDGPVTGRTSGGSIQIDRAASVHAKTSGGSVSVGRSEGDVDVTTSGGSISIDYAGGEVFAKTSGGGIKLGEVHGAIDAKTSGGAIRAAMATQPRNNSTLKTSGGSITVFLPPSVELNLDAKTSGGKVFSDLPVASIVNGSASNRKLTGTINGGGPVLHVRGSGGSIHLKSI